MPGSGGKLGDNYRRSKKVQPGSKTMDQVIRKPPSPAELARRAGRAIKSGAEAVRNKVQGTPEKSPQWKRDSAKIADQRAKVKTARDLKRMPRSGRG